MYFRTIKDSFKPYQTPLRTIEHIARVDHFFDPPKIHILPSNTSPASKNRTPRIIIALKESQVVINRQGPYRKDSMNVVVLLEGLYLCYTLYIFFLNFGTHPLRALFVVLLYLNGVRLRLKELFGLAFFGTGNKKYH